MRVSLVVVTVMLLGACTLGNVFSLTIGDCFNSGPDLEVIDVDLVDCERPHSYEVYSLFNVQGSTWPGTASVSDSADIGCFSRFRAYVGTDYQYSEYYISHLAPTEDSWRDADDREVVCILTTDDQATSGSARGSRR